LAEFSFVTLLYTAHLAGEIALLPRLFALISQERRAAHGPVILLDLGDTCSVESWLCRATQGRAPFLVLDSMGYDGAVIGGPEQTPIPPSSLRRLLDNMIMPVILWNRAVPIIRKGITFTVAAGDAPLPDQGPGVRIDRSTYALPDARDPVPTLGDVAQAHLARVDMTWPEWTVQSARLIQVEPDTPVDPTIAAVVELVETEARYYAQQGGD
jgi:2',3'-cyclic-nucleotide 2'-phosphodiesterase (5'-nucleotidase family)